LAFSANINESRIFWGVTLERVFIRRQMGRVKEENGRGSEKKVDKPK